MKEYMRNKPYIMTMCGSTRFKEDFEKWNKIFTLQNYIVLMPSIFSHTGDDVSEKQKIQLDKLHQWKIRMADIIFVIDTDKYIGESTKEEIAFAQLLGIPIIYASAFDSQERLLN